MKTRIIGGLLGAAVFIPLIFAGGRWLSIGLLIFGLIALHEVAHMQQIHRYYDVFLPAALALNAVLVPEPYDLLQEGLAPLSVIHLAVILLLIGTVRYMGSLTFEDVAVLIFASLYIGQGFHAVIELRTASLYVVWFLFIAIWSTDIGAYLVGRHFGKRKLAPKVSPNKTVEGACGGVLIAVVSTSIYAYFCPEVSSLIKGFPIVAVFLSIFGQLGDLAASAMKRHYQVKDSGKLIPGHGGILDRFDSTLFASFILLVWQTLPF